MKGGKAVPPPGRRRGRTVKGLFIRMYLRKGGLFPWWRILLHLFLYRKMRAWMRDAEKAMEQQFMEGLLFGNPRDN